MARMNIATIIVHRDTPSLVDGQVEQILEMTSNIPDLHNNLVVIDAGSQQSNRSKYSSFRYEDDPFRGKCFAHNIGLKLINPENYRYIWFNHPDIDFGSDMDCLSKLIDIMEHYPDIGLISPNTTGTNYPGKDVRGPNPLWHMVSTTDYLSLFIRGQVVQEIGFLNKEFIYGWGAIHEYCYNLYNAGWKVAYADNAKAHHLGSTTYGKAPGTVSKDEYRHQARLFAMNYFVENYGPDWDNTFAKVLPPEVKVNTFSHHRERWERFVRETNREP